MKSLSKHEVLGWFVGAGLVYVFFRILDVVTGTPFSWMFFFLYWDIIILFMLGVHFHKHNMAELDREQNS